MGVKKGVPDYIIVIAKEKIQPQPKKDVLVFVEMKRAKGSKVQEEQIQWIKALKGAGCIAEVCNGFYNAKVLIDAILKGEKKPD